MCVACLERCEKSVKKKKKRAYCRHSDWHQLLLTRGLSVQSHEVIFIVPLLKNIDVELWWPSYLGISTQFMAILLANNEENCWNFASVSIQRLLFEKAYILNW